MDESKSLINTVKITLNKKLLEGGIESICLTDFSFTDLFMKLISSIMRGGPLPKPFL